MPGLWLAFLFLLAASHSATGHSFLVCTHLNEADPFNACTQQDNNPYHPSVKPGFKHNYNHPSAGPLCVGRNDGYGMDASPTVPKMKAGSTTVLAWAADDHSIFKDPTIADDGGFLGRFVYVFRSPVTSPDDSIFKTAPYAQLDFQACGNKIGNFGIPTSADPGHICKGNLTLSKDLQEGVHTFVWAWKFFTVGEELQNPIFDYVTCFQIDITNDSPSASIAPTGTLPAATWSAVYHSPFAPMKGLMQTLDAVPAQWHRANGDAFPVLVGPATVTPTTTPPKSALPKTKPITSSFTNSTPSYAPPSYLPASPSSSLIVNDAYYNTLTAEPSNATAASDLPIVVDSSGALPLHITLRFLFMPVFLVVVWLVKFV